MTVDAEQINAVTRSLRAGPLSAEFDTLTGAIRNICFGEEPVWSELVVLVRDDHGRLFLPRSP